jgi:hypothetical protein
VAARGQQQQRDQDHRGLLEHLRRPAPRSLEVVAAI